MSNPTIHPDGSTTTYSTTYPNVPGPSGIYVSFPSVEAALAELGRRVFGAALVIEPPAPAATTYETEYDPSTLRAQRADWEAMAAQCGRETEYYRDLVIRIGKALGPAAYRCDDGSTATEVLCAKVPELVAVCVIERDTFKTVAELLAKK